MSLRPGLEVYASTENADMLLLVEWRKGSRDCFGNYSAHDKIKPFVINGHYYLGIVDNDQNRLCQSHNLNMQYSYIGTVEANRNQGYQEILDNFRQQSFFHLSD